MTRLRRLFHFRLLIGGDCLQQFPFQLSVSLTSTQPPKRLVVGLALPEDFEVEGLGPPPERIFYKGLTKLSSLSSRKGRRFRKD